MKINKVLVVKGDAGYDVLNHFIDCIANGLSKQGIYVEIFDTRKLDENGIWVDKQYDLIFSINGMWSHAKTQYYLQDKNTYIWDFYVDHPMYHDSRLLNRSFNQIVSFVDKKHVDFCERFYANNYLSKFIPHGGCMQHDLKSWEERKLNVVFLGSYEQPEKYLEPISLYDNATQDVIYDLIDIVWFNPHISLEEAFYYVIENKNIKLPEHEISRFIVEWPFVDKFIRAKKRNDLIATILDSQIEIHVYGKGWKNFQHENEEYLIVHEAVDFQKSLDVMAESKIVLNSMPLFTYGSHERVFNTMGAKAICLTDDSEYLKEEFIDKKHIFYYSYLDYQQAVNIINELLSGHYDVKAIVEQSYELVQKNHTWEKRAEQIVDFLKDIPKTERKKTYFEQINNYICNNSFEKINARTQGIRVYRQQYEKIEVQEDEMIITKRLLAVKGNCNELQNMANILMDNKSKKVFNALLNYYINFDISDLNSIADKNCFYGVDEDIIKLTAEEYFLEYGRAQGSIIESLFYEVANKFVGISSFSRGEEAYRMSQHYLEKYDNAKNYNMIINESEELLSIDAAVKEDITYLKIDLGESVIPVLLGAKNKIIRNHPKIVINIQYDFNDLFCVVNMFKEWNVEYDYYLRYYGRGTELNKLILYAI